MGLHAVLGQNAVRHAFAHARCDETLTRAGRSVSAKIDSFFAHLSPRTRWYRARGAFAQWWCAAANVQIPWNLYSACGVGPRAFPLFRPTIAPNSRQKMLRADPNPTLPLDNRL